MCFDKDFGLTKESEHPFTSGYGTTDVRVTCHYYENLITSSIFSMIHELGHGTYERQCNPKYDNTALSGGTTMAMHESQSRFYENIVGRDYYFWKRHYSKLQKLFRKNLKDVSFEDFYKAVNKSEKSLIRTEADELTYPLHIMVRYDIEKKIFEEAIDKIEKENLKENNALVVGAEDWHHGVIGIVASKITELYFKPSILICFEGEDGKGSGRSIPGFDLHAALCSSSKYLEKYGGHEMAVGLSLKKDKFDDFKKVFEEIAKEANTEEIVPVIKIDKEINLKDITLESVKSLKLLEPFGESNKTPIFIYKNLKIDSIRALSEGKHLKLTLKDGNTIINAIGFNMGKCSEEYLIGDKVDIIGVLETNVFNGVESVQINMKDIRKSY